MWALLFSCVVVAMCIASAFVFSQTMKMYETNAATLRRAMHGATHGGDGDDDRPKTKNSTVKTLVVSDVSEIPTTNTGLLGTVHRSQLRGTAPVYSYVNIDGEKCASYAVTDEGTTTITYTSNSASNS